MEDGKESWRSQRARAGGNARMQKLTPKQRSEIARSAAQTRWKNSGKGGAFWVHCAICAHEWIAAYLPQNLTLFCKRLKRIYCPSCLAGSDDILYGKASWLVNATAPAEGADTPDQHKTE
jgi:hypothetical protein